MPRFLTAALLTLLLVTASVVAVSANGPEPLPETEYGNGLSGNGSTGSAQYIPAAGTLCAWGKHPAPQRCFTAVGHIGPPVIPNVSTGRLFLPRVRVRPNLALVSIPIGRSPPVSPSSVALQTLL